MLKRIGLLLLLCIGCFGVTVAQDTPLFDFEDGTQDWLLGADWDSGVEVAVSDEVASEGAQSLSVSVNYDDTMWQEAGVFFQPSEPLDWSAYTTLSADVFVPAEAQNFIAQLYTKTGENWTWANTPDIPLIPGEWTTISADLRQLGLRADVHEFGIKFATYEANFTGEFYVDRVMLSSVAQGQDELTTVPAEVRSITAVTPLQMTAGQYEKFEVVVELDATFNNPYDPLDIRLDAEFTSPSGETMVVPGFYYQDFEFTIDGAAQTVNAVGEPSWRVRFAPTEVGEWSYRVQATTTASGTVSSEWQTFTTLESDNPGFIRVDSRNSRYFAFDDGTPYFAVGENIGWSTGNSLADYQMWLDALSASGGNFMRVWMASWEFGIEWLDTGLGDYSRRQDRAFELDQVFNMAHERGIYLMLSLLNHGAFSETTNPEWSSNPYNAANGGPLETPGDFGTNEEAERLWQQRLRYIAARWAYSTNLMTWEWWNEVNWTPMVDSDLLAPWIERSAEYLGTLDPYHHMITHSGSPVSDSDVWGQESMSFTQNHLYNMNNLVFTFETSIPTWLDLYDKPFLMGEFGSPVPIDIHGVLLHTGLWSAPMNGAAGTAMTWWWDTYIHPNDLYYHFAGIAAYYADEDMGAREWEISSATLNEGADANLYGMQASDYALLWVVSADYNATNLINLFEANRQNGVEEPRNVTFPEITGVSVTVTGLADGTYTVELWDTFTGQIAESYQVEVSGGTVTVELPPFTADWAIKIKP